MELKLQQLRSFKVNTPSDPDAVQNPGIGILQEDGLDSFTGEVGIPDIQLTVQAGRYFQINT